MSLETEVKKQADQRAKEFIQSVKYEVLRDHIQGQKDYYESLKEVGDEYDKRDAKIILRFIATLKPVL